MDVVVSRWSWLLQEVPVEQVVVGRRFLQQCCRPWWCLVLVERVVVQRFVVSSLLVEVCAKVDVEVLWLWKEAVLVAPVVVEVVLWKLFVDVEMVLLDSSTAVAPEVELVEHLVV